MKKYFFDEVINTQEIAHKKYVDKPVLIVAKRQTKGRGRKGNEWINSDPVSYTHLTLPTNREV